MNNLTIDQKLIHIGFRLTGTEGKISSKDWIDIEETIFEATLEVQNDARIFLILCSWVKVHGNRVVIEKLMKHQRKKNSVWLIALAIYAVQEKHITWSKLIKKVNGKHALVPMRIATTNIEYKGGDEIFLKNGFLIPKGSIRVRDSDVATPEKLARENLQYKNRLLFGANWRSDVITAIQKGMENPYRITKSIGCSYPSAYRIFHDYKIFLSA